jgi:hypothetical protein
MAATVVNVVGKDGPPTNNGRRKRQQGSTFSLAKFVRGTWAQLLVDVAIFCVGLAVALYLFFTLGRWERDNIKTIYARRSEELAGILQSQINSFEARFRSLFFVLLPAYRHHHPPTHTHTQGTPTPSSAMCVRQPWNKNMQVV